MGDCGINIMRYGRNKIGLSLFIFIVYSFYYISGYSSPLHNYIIVGLFLLWNFVAAIEDNMAYSYAFGSKSCMWLFLFLIYYFFTSIFVGGLIYTLEYVIIYLCLYGTAIQYRYYYYRNSYKEILRIVQCLLLGFVMFSLSAIIFYIFNPSAARVLASDFYAFDTIAIGGGYSIAFGASILSVYLFELLIHRKEMKVNRSICFLFLLLILLFEILLIKTESTITLIANISGIFASIFNKFYNGKNGKKQNKLIVCVGILIVFLIFVMYMNEIGSWITDITANGTDNVILRRLNRIGLKLKYQGIQFGYTNYVDERLDTIMSSWQVFLQYPLFGIGYKYGNAFSLLSKNGLGAHSELVDILAQFGIVGFFFWAMFFKCSIKNQYNVFHYNGWKVSLFIMLIFNPFKSFHGYVVIFVLIPLLEYLLYTINTKFVKREEYK